MSIYAVNGKVPIAAWIPSRDTAGNGTTTLTDLVGGNNGTLTNMDAATDWVADTGAGGVRALDFDGTDDIVVVPYSSQFLASNIRSIAGWINVRSFDGSFQVNDVLSTDSVFSPSLRGWNIGVSDPNNNNSDGTLSFIIFGTGGGYIVVQISTETLAINQWYHFVVTYNGGTLASGLSIFLDGQQQVLTTENSGTFTAPNSPSNNLWFGRRPGITVDTFFNGQLDDIRIFNQILDAADISYLYNGGNGRGRTQGNLFSMGQPI